MSGLPAAVDAAPAAGVQAVAEERASPRNAGFDALRGALTLLVVLHHTAITYGAIGGWFYREVRTDRSLSSTLLVLFCTVNQTWFMGLFFLLAGYYTPGAIARHGLRRYAVDRLMRLGLPLLFFGYVLGPATIALAATARGRDFTDTLARLWHSGTFENGPLWFAQALLLFAAAAMVWTWLRPVPPAPRPAGTAPWPADAALLGAALVTGAAALALRTAWPVGVNVWGLQLGYFASYVVLFGFGAIAARRRWLEDIPPDKVRRWWRIALVALPTLPILYFASRAVPALGGRVLGGVYAFWEPLVAWGVILKLLWLFQRRFAVLGGGGRALARRAYTIFIIHPPVLVAVALAWRSVAAPALLKFVVTGSVSCAVCFVVAGGLLRIPALRKIL